jgi:GH25 family lysozyme M1 (1,4-beta-N-acetylmuramidase)
MTLIVESKMLRDAKAGNYKPSLYGRARTILFSDARMRVDSLLGLDVDLVDISFYQRFANFPNMLDKGIKGAIIRAGQNLWADEDAETYMTNAEQAGMPIGSYWFYDSRVSPGEQADLWKKVLGTHKTPLMCWADYEEKYGGEYSGWDAFYQFLEACRSKMPDREFGIYTGYYYWIEHSPNPITQKANLDYFGQYPLWLAWYANDIGFVKIPQPWTKMTFWQYTDKGDGTYYGVGSLGLDMNKFLGTLEEFRDMFNLEENGDTEMPDITFEGTVKPGVTAIVRETPAGNATTMRIYGGNEIKGVGVLVPAVLNGITYHWMNLVSPAQGWVAASLLDYHAVDPTPTPATHTIEVYVDGVLEYSREF